MLQAMEVHYRRHHASEFVAGIALDVDSYDLLAGYMMNDDVLKYEYAEWKGLPESIQGIPIMVSDKSGVQICVKPSFSSLYGLPTLST